MTDISVSLTDADIEDARNLLCREGETVSTMIKRTILSEINNRKLKNDLGKKKQ